MPSKDEQGVTPVYVPAEAQDERKRFAQFLNTLRRNETLPVVVRETASKWVRFACAADADLSPRRPRCPAAGRRFVDAA